MTIVRNTTTIVRKAELSPGESVEVVLASGDLAERVVWEVSGELVYVCTEKTYERLQRGDVAAQPIGFPMCDVRALA